MDDKLLIERHFLAWRQPGQDEAGRVELVPGDGLLEPEPFAGRTANEITIPAGSLLSYVTTEDDPTRPSS